MKLVYGTTNQAKIHFMKRRVKRLDIEILSLEDVGAPRFNIEECGKNQLENARIKAHAYYKALNMPVFSCDSGLYIEGLDDARQPGINIRGPGDRMDDNEAIDYYTSLATEFGGFMAARYQNAICLVADNTRYFEYMGDEIASERFYIVTRPHEKRVKGFPIDSISVDIESGLYYYDIEGHEEKYINDCYVAFFEMVLTELQMG